MSEPTIAQKTPYSAEVKAGDKIFWCACGRSANQPMCDGSHKGTGIAPVAVKAEKDGTVWLCGCKHTKTPPFCDGSHNDL
ncbi:MAG: CDGSH iron-sulfur domain-containing protein [Magnetospirillum sp.]|nr:CDGSH iron-sulfur domain-containing protein [Magnetospirillum sp.]